MARLANLQLEAGIMLVGHTETTVCETNIPPDNLPLHKTMNLPIPKFSGCAKSVSRKLYRIPFKKELLKIRTSLPHHGKPNEGTRLAPPAEVVKRSTNGKEESEGLYVGIPKFLHVSDFPLYWLFNRDPYYGLLKSLYNWVL